MLFNTFNFLFVYLPLTLFGYYLISKRSVRLSNVFLLFASLVFYGYWKVAYLPLLVGSIAVNFVTGRSISKSLERQDDGRARTLMIVGVGINLCLLATFKYLDFLIANVDWLTGAHIQPVGLGLPIGISFFTFTQIAYLVDCRTIGVREYHPENFALFVTYFPHLIAGPILHHRDMVPQFGKPEAHAISLGRMVVGGFFLVIGLAKKVILADGLARFVSPLSSVRQFSDETCVTL